eukprot:CAMPEP_0170777590 /NCGR_PEP_ID=MMETSP0733-20121128/11872_1 /TAXON_ID=186038 /ORGANISM="Fragilariopsis kerguelensis, Strain L26-C5" /LENGTH=185 /DNA_ID=CAMNT_0011120823 /DNA_START=68 /DNA_END=626 /DNA_ORIENTATION=-
MTTESYQNTKSADTGDSTSKNDEVVIDNGNANKRSFLIIAGSLLALLVLVVAGQNVGQDLSSSANDIAKGASALADYQVDIGNSALTNDIFGMGAVSENEVGNCINPTAEAITVTAMARAARSVEAACVKNIATPTAMLTIRTSTAAEVAFATASAVSTATSNLVVTTTAFVGREITNYVIIMLL